MHDKATTAQRAYYSRTAEHYDAMQVRDDDEHGIALAAFVGMVRLCGARTILDVGAGSGRALKRLQAELPDCTVIGIEPVAELRGVGHRAGIRDDTLIEGDALTLEFGDDSFDFVIETGVLHHIATPGIAVGEMVRVARMGVMLSDSNKFGQGSPFLRWVKMLIDRLGLWKAMIWLTTGGRIAKWSEGDGIFFSYSVFDSIALIRRKFPRVIHFNTADLVGTDLKRGSAHIAVVALRNMTHA